MLRWCDEAKAVIHLNISSTTFRFYIPSEIKTIIVQWFSVILYQVLSKPRSFELSDKVKTKRKPLKQVLASFWKTNKSDISTSIYLYLMYNNLITNSLYIWFTIFGQLPSCWTSFVITLMFLRNCRFLCLMEFSRHFSSRLSWGNKCLKLWSDEQPSAILSISPYLTAVLSSQVAAQRNHKSDTRAHSEAIKNMEMLINISANISILRRAAELSICY